jgi:hypothetical protein
MVKVGIVIVSGFLSVKPLWIQATPKGSTEKGSACDVIKAAGPSGGFVSGCIFTEVSGGLQGEGVRMIGSLYFIIK